MKRRLSLFAGIALAGILALSYLYDHSQSDFAEHHQRVLGMISLAKQVKASLDANLMLVRDFRLLNYDPLTEDQRRLREVCREMDNEELRPSSLAGPLLEEKVDHFCEQVERLHQLVERFKTENAILRNSIFYVQGVAAGRRGRTYGYHNSQAVLNATLSYYLIPNEVDREYIQRRLKEGDPRFAPELYRHVREIFQRRAGVNELLDQALHSGLSRGLEDFTRTYNNAYARAEVSALRFRMLLFWSAVLLLLLVLYGFARLIRAATSLKESNENLEERVRERTRELSNSQRLILQQQQTLLASGKMSALGEMAAGLAHEINNPLAIIQLSASQLVDLLAREPLRKDLVRARLTSIESTTERIAKIVQGLRTFSRDGSRDAFTRVSVTKLVEETVAFCRERFRNNGVALTIELPPEPLYFEGRDTQISQVLLNLLLNAFDAIERQPGAWVKVSAAVRGPRIEVRVTDSGKGLPAEIHKKIFQPFFTTKEVGKGTGMGLSISLGIVQAHGGTLRLDEGAPHTSFVVELPRLEPLA